MFRVQDFIVCDHNRKVRSVDKVARPDNLVTNSLSSVTCGNSLIDEYDTLACYVCVYFLRQARNKENRLRMDLITCSTSPRNMRPKSAQRHTEHWTPCLVCVTVLTRKTSCGRLTNVSRFTPSSKALKANWGQESRQKCLPMSLIGYPHSLLVSCTATRTNNRPCGGNWICFVARVCWGVHQQDFGNVNVNAVIQP